MLHTKGVAGVLFLKKYLDCYILTEINYDLEKFNIYSEAKKHRKDKRLIVDNDKKLDNNLIRSRQKIFDYAYNNEFNYFITLTISSKFDRSDYISYMRRFYEIIKTMRSSCGKIEFLLVPEFHKDGINVHFHGLLFAEDLKKEIYLNCNGFYSIKSLDTLGYNSISPIKDNFNVSCYITKYVTKNKMNVAGKRQHSYFKSNGLVLPKSEKIEKIIEIDKWDFENFYCRKVKLPLNFFD